MRSMKAAVLHAPGDLRIEEVGIPKIEKTDDVIVRVRSVGICGSDVHRIMTTGAYRHPLIPGHEFSGQVYETGKDVTGINAGDRVVAVPIKPYYLEEATSMGAAITAGVGIGELAGFHEINKFIKVDTVCKPNQENMKMYAQIIPIFNDAYLALEDVFDKLKTIKAPPAKGI